MKYDKETAHREIREAIAAWVLDKTLPEPVIQQTHSEALPKLAGREHFLRSCDFLEFLLKPKPQPMIRVNGILCPAPETVVPAAGTLYYIPNVDSKEKFVGDTWGNFQRDLRLLEAGLVYLTIENTVARSYAMLKYQVVV
jgi:hypothetical protein